MVLVARSMGWDLLLFRQRRLQGGALLHLLHQVQVVRGELHQLTEGTRLRPRGVAAHILLKVHGLHHLGQGDLPIKVIPD